jgi:hypothetical protein
MNFLEFIFKLLWQFITFEDGRWAELKEKAFAWRNKVEKEANDPELLEENKLWYHKLIPHDNEWYVQLGLAVFFLFAVKTVRTWLLTDGSLDSDDDDDDDDSDEMPLHKVRQMNRQVFPTASRM